MPKRSNDFQKLVYLVKRHAASGSTVTESKMLIDRNTGSEREVDVCIESAIAGHSLLICVECRDQGRAASVQWVEEMKGKHERLPTNKLVLVSSSKFTQEALDVAQNYGIETITLDRLDGGVAERLFGDASSLWSKIFTLNVMKVVMRVAPSGDLAAEKVRVMPDNIFYNYEGKEVGTVRQLVDAFTSSDQVAHEIGQNATNNHKGFYIEWPTGTEQSNEAIYLMKMEPNILRPIESVEITGSCTVEVSEYPLQHGVLGRVKIAWGSGLHLGREALLVALEDQESSGRLSISIEPKPTTPATKPKRL